MEKFVFVEASIRREIVKHMPDLGKNGYWHFARRKTIHGENTDCDFCMSANREWQFIII